MNPFMTLNNQIEVTRLLNNRNQECLKLAAQARNGKNFRYANQVEQHSRNLRKVLAAVRVLPSNG